MKVLRRLSLLVLHPTPRERSHPPPLPHSPWQVFLPVLSQACSWTRPNKYGDATSTRTRPQDPTPLPATPCPAPSAPTRSRLTPFDPRCPGATYSSRKSPSSSVVPLRYLGRLKDRPLCRGRIRRRRHLTEPARPTPIPLPRSPIRSFPANPGTAPSRPFRATDSVDKEQCRFLDSSTLPPHRPVHRTGKAPNAQQAPSALSREDRRLAFVTCSSALPAADRARSLQ